MTNIHPCTLLCLPQIVSIPPTKSGHAKFTLALRQSPYVRGLLDLDAERWAAVGEGFKVDVSQLSSSSAAEER